MTFFSLLWKTEVIEEETNWMPEGRGVFWGMTMQAQFIFYFLCQDESGSKWKLKLRPTTDENITETEYAAIKRLNPLTSTDDLAGSKPLRKGLSPCWEGMRERQERDTFKVDRQGSHTRFSTLMTMEYTSYEGQTWHPSEKTVSEDH